MCVDIENKQLLRFALNDFNKLSNCFKKTYLSISVTKEVVQTFVFEARESFKFKSVFMLLFFFSVFFWVQNGTFPVDNENSKLQFNSCNKIINILQFSIMYEKRNFYKKYLERLCWFSSYMVYSLKQA